MPKTLAGKTALITGASSGIGAAFALFLAGRGLRVILTARRGERLRDLVEQIKKAGGEAVYYPCDLSDIDDRQRMVQTVKEKHDPVDILINNAGFGWYGYFHKMSWNDAAQMLAVNIESAVHLSRLFLPQMIARGQGHIINISSIAGGLPNQGIAMYAASKAFIDAFTTSLYRETRGSGVTASTMRLGPVETEFYDQAKKKENGSAVPAEKWAIPVEPVNKALWRLLIHPRRVMYIPAWLRISAIVEPLFGWAIDPLGPLLLRRKND
jgi:short-subunit dehydrogenase